VKLSTDHIMTTHVGSLPRPPDLLAMLEAREAGRGFDEAAFEARLAAAVRDIVEKQVACGIDSVCDGEQSKISYTFYVRHRLAGIGAFRGAEVDKPPQTGAHRDLLDHPDAAERLIRARRRLVRARSGAVLRGPGDVSRPPAARHRSQKSRRRLRRGAPGRSLHERRLAGRSDQIRAGYLLQK
jgi:hypothetical protein